MWTQNLTLTENAVTATSQELQDPSQETCNQSPQMLLAGCNLVKPSLAESSLAKPSLAESSLTELSLAELNLAESSHDQLTEYD